MSSSIKNDGEMKKFLFDTHDFDKTEPETPAAPAVMTYSEDQLMLAKTQAYAQGKQEAALEAQAAQELQTHRLLESMIAQAERLIAAEDRREIESMAQATKLAMRVTHKLLPQMADRFALTEIERVILASLDVRKDEQRIAIMVSPAHMDTLKSRIDALAMERGFAGKLILIADDTLGVSDCRVEWADGGAERMYERLFAQIETEFAKAIAVMQKTIEPDTE
ncbi:MAG: FliH/SctL family protein [Bdellovibrionales bacterium]|jgi:flagellar assembly protein FliH|nr:FliH/SctL family protein [Bdellovibrionales bacterium]